MSYTPKDCMDVLIYIKNNPTIDVSQWGIKELDINDIVIQFILNELHLSELIDVENKITEKDIKACPK